MWYYDEVLYWAKEGDAEAQFRLEYMYEYGSENTQKDKYTAIGWYKKAVAQENEYAKSALKRMKW